jgi:Mlc titration factor MtfA (ptsG expression regulator)
MPPDTIYIPGQTGPPPMVGDPYADSLIRSLWQDQLPAQEVNDRPQFIFPEWGMLLIVLGIIAVLYIIHRPFRSYTDDYLKTGLSKRAGKLLETNRLRYNDWLSRYNPYYRSLSPELKEFFLFRVAAFILVKKFRFHSMKREDFITVLVSGAAVQMTFGLRNFLLDFFPVIHIVSKEYLIGHEHATYYGHVNPNGIHVAWNQFLDGYEQYSDSVNVGLHEMAHAVSFDVFFGETDHQDYKFRERMQDFLTEGRSVFRAMKKSDTHLLDDYATTNLEEFWAVSAETFFENPAEFKQRLPNLYAEMCHLLNQDPLLPGKIINIKIAGLEIGD